MAKLFNKIPVSTFDDVQLEAGMLLKNFNPENPQIPADDDIICATTGGITVNCTPTYSDMGADVDNCPDNTKELKKLDGWNCTMAFTALSANEEVFKLALGAADKKGSAIIPRRDLNKEDFADEIWWVGDKGGSGMAAIVLKNALSTGGFSLKTTKNGKGQMDVELTGHVSINSLDEVPMEFYVTD